MLKRERIIQSSALLSALAFVILLFFLSPLLQLNPETTVALAIASLGVLLFVLLRNRTVARSRRIQQALHDKISALQLLSKIEQTLNSQLSLPDQISLLADSTLAQLHADFAVVSLLDPVTGILRPIAARGLDDPEQFIQTPLQVWQASAAWVAQHGKPLLSSNVMLDSRWAHILPAPKEEFNSYLGVPLQIENHVIGVLDVMTRAAREFESEEIEFISALATRASVAIQNARLYEQSQRRATQLSILNEIGQAVSSLSSLEGTLEIIYQQVQRIVPLDVFYIALYDAETGVLSYPLLYDGGERYNKTVETLSTHSFMGKAIWTGQPQLLNRSAEELASFTPSLMLGDESKVSASLLIAPLQIGARNIGAVSAQSYQRDAYTQEHLSLLTGIGHQAAIAIENARLFSSEQLRAMELEALRQASLSLTSSLDLTEVFDAVLENTMRIAVEAQNAHIYLYQDDQLNFGASLWADGRKGQQWSTPREKGLTYTVARQGEMIVVPDMREHPLFEHAPYSNKGAIIGLPLKSGNQILGVMNVAYPRPRAFNAAELRALELLGDQAANAIANARLHNAMQVSEERYRTLVENIPIAVYRVTPGPTGKFLMANPAHLKMVGFESLEELQQINVSDLYVDAGGRKAFSDLVLEKGAISGYEQHLKKKDGTPIWALVTARMVYQDHQPVYFDCTSIDITVRKKESMARAQAEETLRQRTRELEALLQISNSATNLDMETVLTDIATHARDLLHATEATVFLMEENDQLLRPLVALGEYTSERLALTLRPGEGIVGWVAQHREAVIVNHGIEDARIKHVPGTPEEDESLMIAPLIRGNEVLGIILLNRLPATGFTQNELDLLVGMAAQASAAIANARLFEETRRSALEQRIVSEISGALNATLDVYEAFPVVVKGIRALVDCDRISLALLDPDKQFFTMVKVDELRPELAQGTRMPISGTASASDILQGYAHLTPDLSAEINYSAEQMLSNAGYRSRINLPLIVGEHSIGALNLVSRRLAAFNHTQTGPLQQIANTIAIALENTELFQAELTRREELAALYSLSRQLADVTNSETILRLVTQHVVETVHVTFARISLIENEEFVVRAAYPIRLLDRDLKVGLHLSLAQSTLSRQVLNQGLSTIVHTGDPRASELESQALCLDLVKSLCLIPLRLGDHAIGLMTLGEERREEREHFTPDKIRLAQNIGDQAASALHRAELFAELENAYLQTVFTLANAVDAKDSDTNVHSQRLSNWAQAIGEKLGLSPRALEDLRYGALLHDIGKIGVPDAILKKPAQLDVEEWLQMHQHPVIGAKIIEPLARLAGAAAIVRHHHERYDGNGYPDGLSGDAIPIGARILTVVDAYGAMIDKRVYKNGRTPEEARYELRRCSGTQFDPRLVDLFLEILSESVTLESSR